MTAFPNQQILDLADSFFDASEILARSRANAIPILNLRCHSIELFLKSLHVNNISTDIGWGVSLIRPASGHDIRHGLRSSFERALKEHQDELLCDMPLLLDELGHLEGAFQKSRYLYEAGDSVPVSTAERVSRYLSIKISALPLLEVDFDGP